jgi:hypothetical protein
LGWRAFQHLCVAIVSELFGQVVQGFADSHDAGRDGAFFGNWKPVRGEAFEGSYTVQCKFTAQASKSVALAELYDELAKAARLASRGLADNYILFTNARLTGATDEKITAAFQAIPGIKRFAAFGPERISQFIRESPRLRMLVPRVYGLGDLSQILDERAYAQAQEILSSLGDDLSKFVITNAYRNAAKALVEHGFVMLLGEPACGKTSIAAALALGAVDEWGCSTVKVRDAAYFVDHSNPHETKQFFWIDDAFGATQLDLQGTLEWNTAFPHIRAAMRRGAKFVFTSRDYIYRNARNFLKESGLPVLNESQVVIRVEELSKDEREQILYNHIRLGTQPKDFNRRIKSFLPSVAAHPRFSPEIARRLGNPTFTKRLQLSEPGLRQFVEQPIEWLQEIIRTLDAGSRAAIAIVFMRGGMLASPMKLTAEEQGALDLLGATIAEVGTALTSLDGSLLILVYQSGGYWRRFKHPTVLDAFAGLVAENRELLDIYLLGTPVNRLLREVACGDIDLPGTKVHIPNDRYDAFCARLESFLASRRDNRSEALRFLAHRCDRAFLKRFIARNAVFVEGLNVGSYFYAVSDVDVIDRLYEYGLLPEGERQRHLAEVRELAANVPDAGFLKKSVVQFLTPDEIDEILAHVRATLIGDLDTCIDQWRDNHDGKEDPDGYFDHLKTALADYRGALDYDEAAVDLIDTALAKIDRVIDELQSEHPEPPDYEGYHGRSLPREAYEGSRSVFDDVDQ